MGLLQRKCACGGSAGLGGQCDACQAKKLLGLQTKLAVNEPGDVYEQEADRIAEQVMAAPAHPAVSGAPPRIQRFSGQSNEQMDAAPASVDHALASPGRPLEPALRQDMEQRFGHDFSRVRVHSDEAAEQSARDVNAHAYTVGHDIVFGEGRFVPGTREGQRLLAHELTHVIQQWGGRDGSGAHPFHISPSGQCIARQGPPPTGKEITDWLTPRRVIPPSPKPKPPEVRTSDRPRRTRVRVAITGHASPRWSGARSSLQADKLNQELSQKREKRSVTGWNNCSVMPSPISNSFSSMYNEQALTMTPLTSARLSMSNPARLGRSRLFKRRVKPHVARTIRLCVASTSASVFLLPLTPFKPQKPRRGARYLVRHGTGRSDGDDNAGGSRGGRRRLQLHVEKPKTGQEVEGWAEYGLGGVGASVPIPTIDMGDYENFSTKQPANFSDFDYKRFTIGSAGFNALLFGYEWSSMSIWGLPGGKVDDIDVGGFVMGGAGIDIGSESSGCCG